MAEGELIAFADHDDVLTPDALFECVRALNRRDDISVLYSDEDKMTMDAINSFSLILNRISILIYYAQ